VVRRVDGRKAGEAGLEAENAAVEKMWEAVVLVSWFRGRGGVSRRGAWREEGGDDGEYVE
jgi:hypothetical protein